MTMIERAAKGLFYATVGGPDDGDAWPKIREKDRDEFRRKAKAVIEAMREPTKEIIEAGWNAGQGEFETPPPVDVAWRAMINAALK